MFCIGLGKASQGISTALSVEKTSKRGGKIVNASAEIGMLYYGLTTWFEVNLWVDEQMEQEKKKVQSMVDVMKNPTKIVLLQVCT